MSKIIIASLVFFAAANVLSQDMRQNSFQSLFSDQKANRIGDAITIVVLESSQASNNAETSAGKKSDLGFTASGTIGSSSPIPNTDIGIGSNNDFTGSGSTKTTGMVQTKISATIDSVLANGNLVIKGSRRISINGEEQTIFIKGVVRSSDIQADNSVYSYNISEAEIVFEGSGMIDNAQHPGWLTKFFHWIF
jgi:flagellar L-ring protein precursor FlgH